MGVLAYVGKTPVDPDDITTRDAAEDELNSGVSRGYVDGRAHDLALATRASKVYVDTQDELYAETNYPVTQDALLVPSTARGVANGVASLVAGKVPIGQIPVLGAGILKGPYGHTVSYTVANAGTVPQKIADVASASFGVNTLTPLVFMQYICTSANNGRPVIEVRMSLSGDTTYAGQTLIARGVGRGFYNDAQTIPVFPVAAALSEGQDGVVDTIAGTATFTITAWLYEATGASTATVGTLAGYALSTAVYFPRSSL